MSSTNSNVPMWIEPKLFENVLRETVAGFSQIINFKASHALAPGENYATVMIKIEVEVLLQNGNTCNQSFMLKVPHNTELFRNEISLWNMFATEAGMYQEVVAELEKMYEAVNFKVKFGADCYKLPIQTEYILLENLTQKGFRNVPRQDGLDLEHCESVLKKLAQWHAASAVRVEQKGPYQYNYTKGIFMESGRKTLKTMLDSSFKHLLNAAGKLPDCENCFKELKDLKDTVTDLFYKQSITYENEFNTLNHGDCWSNNIMFRYDGAGKLQETYLIDLQVPCYGSPAQDLLYFIITSAQLDIKLNKFDYMIKYYYDNLLKHLRLLKYSKPVPKLKDLQISLIRHGRWGFFAAMITMAAVLCDPTDKASVDNLIGDCQEADKFKEIMYTNERYLKHLQVILPWLCYRGVFQMM